MTEDESFASVWLPESVVDIRVQGPAEVHLDRVKHMERCTFNRCRLMYLGQRVSGFAEWLRRAGLDRK